MCLHVCALTPTVGKCFDMQERCCKHLMKLSWRHQQDRVNSCMFRTLVMTSVYTLLHRLQGYPLFSRMLTYSMVYRHDQRANAKSLFTLAGLRERIRKMGFRDQQDIATYERAALRIASVPLPVRVRSCSH